MNLYYDLNRPRSYKRPDWYAVPDVPHLYGDEREPRLNYVIWQEKAAPFVVVELLSPSTEDEDPGRTQREPDESPTKWEVYEQILGTLGMHPLLWPLFLNESLYPGVLPGLYQFALLALRGIEMLGLGIFILLFFGFRV